jgi:hypothetical protein
MLMDNEAREPIHGARTTATQTFTLPVQAKWNDAADPTPMEGGPREEDRGYILARMKDMDLYLGPGERIKRGDRIVAMGVLTGLDLYITGTEPIGHYPDQAGATMVKYRFADRHPVHQAGDL